MALVAVDFEAMRALHKAVAAHLDDVQWDGRMLHPAPVGWADVGTALELGLNALEAAGYRIVRDERPAP